MEGKTIKLLSKEIPSVYKLVVLAARRAQELYGGSPKLVESRSKKMLEVALEEIQAGKISFKAVGESDKK